MQKRVSKIKKLLANCATNPKGAEIPLGVLFGGLRETANEVKKAASECEQAVVEMMNTKGE